MTVEERKAFQERHYAEAMRYMANAEEALKKSGRDSRHYSDKKYVRSACGIAYSGLLLALEAWLILKGVDVPDSEGKNGKRKKQYNFYSSNIAKLNRKMHDYLDSAYHALHLDGYYDGLTTVKIIRAGFEDAYWLIDKIKPAA